MAHRHGDGVLRLVREPAGQQLEEDDAERVHVAGLARRLAPRLLRRDVVARAHDRPGQRHALGAARVRDAEVGHLGAALVGEQHVLRLDVAVDDAAAVRRLERPRDLQPELDHRRDGQRALTRDELLEVLAADVLEDDVRPPTVLAAVDDRDDVRVRELGDGARLAAEALERLGVLRELLVEDLQRDRPLEQPVVRAVDGRHAAGADQLLQLVAPRNELSDHAGSVVLPLRGGLL